MNSTDLLKQNWACLTCNTTFEAGRMKSGPMMLDPFRCPNCNAPGCTPADGQVRETQTYRGERGTIQ